eukprot:COSAG01_NODE_494_length_16322_cov_35.380879_12_plen_56_part_00
MTLTTWWVGGTESTEISRGSVWLCIWGCVRRTRTNHTARRLGALQGATLAMLVRR